MTHRDVSDRSRRFPPLEVGQQIPDELFGDVPAFTPRVARRERLAAAVCGGISIVSIVIADMRRGPGLQITSLTITVLICLVAATVAAIRVVRLQRLALDRLRRGRYPNGRDTPPSMRRGRRRAVMEYLVVLLGSIPIQALLGDLRAWPWAAISITFIWFAGRGMTPVPDWIRTRVWPG